MYRANEAPRIGRKPQSKSARTRQIANLPTRSPHEVDEQLLPSLGTSLSPDAKSEFPLCQREGLQKREYWIPGGYQQRAIRRPTKCKVPRWARDEKTLRKRILGPSIRRYRVAYLFWLCGFNAREVAEEMNISQNKVEMILRQMRKPKRGEQ